MYYFKKGVNSSVCNSGQVKATGAVNTYVIQKKKQVIALQKHLHIPEFPRWLIYK